MPGTSEGAKKAAQTVKLRRGADFHATIAAKTTEAWEKNGRKPRGFATMSPEKRREAGQKGASVKNKSRKI